MDVDSSIGKDYPPRLNADGDGPLKGRSINHSCLLGHLTSLKDAIGEEVWDHIKKSKIGVVLKLHDNNYIWGSSVVEYLLDRQLAIKRGKEIWSLVRGQPIRFSLHEFEHITGLNCEPKPEDKCDVDHTDFWNLIGIKDHAAGPRYDELKNALGRARSWNYEERRRFGCLFVVVVGLFGAPHNSTIDLDVAKRVLDERTLEMYPWGRVAFEKLIDSIKVQTKKVPYNLHGCVHVLLIWAYETITVFGDKFGNKKNVTEVPLLCWGGSRPRINLDGVLDKEIEAHGMVRLTRHLIEKPEAEIYPVWSDDDVDEQLHNLIIDLLNKRSIQSSWSVKHQKKKRKKNVLKEDELSTGNSNEEIRKTKSSSGESSRKKQKKADMEKNAKQAPQKESDEEVRDESSASDILKELGKLGDKFDALEKNVGEIGGKIDAMENSIREKMETTYAMMDKRMDEKIKKSVSELESKLSLKISELEKELNKLKATVLESSDADEANSKCLLWKVEEKMTSGDNFPVQYVVKETANKSRVKVSTNTVKKEHKDMSIVNDKKRNEEDGKALSMSKVKMYGMDTKDNKAGQKKDKRAVPYKAKKKERVVQEDSDLVDITEQLREEEKKMCSASEDTWSNPDLQQSSKQVRNTLNRLTEALGEGKTPPLGKRVPHLSQTQVEPYIGNSTMKRVITETPSEALYNPFDPADEDKVNELYDWMLFLDEKEEKEEIDFFKTLVTPRKDWPEPDYGWLSSEHLSAALSMLRRRSLRNPSPFHSPRIVFLDQHFVMTWVSEYKLFKADPRCFHFRKLYLEVMNGQHPLNLTHKKWVIDVDHLYLALNVQSNHWVALDVNLKQEKIFVYDSIIRHTEDSAIVEACKPFSRMLPYMLNLILPPKIRKPSKKQFGVHRYKTIPKNKSMSLPQNKNPGDCGVYTFKYIECLALGVSMEGLGDEMIQSMRLKLGVDLLAEVPEGDVKLSKPVN